MGLSSLCTFCTTYISFHFQTSFFLTNINYSLLKFIFNSRSKIYYFSLLVCLWYYKNLKSGNWNSLWSSIDRPTFCHNGKHLIDCIDTQQNYHVGVLVSNVPPLKYLMFSPDKMSYFSVAYIYIIECLYQPSKLHEDNVLFSCKAKKL